MPRKKKSGAAAWVDADEAPELTDEFFDRAEIKSGGATASSAAAGHRCLVPSKR